MSDLNGHDAMPGQGGEAARMAAMADDDLQQFMTRKLRERTFHDTMRVLNDDVLSKNADRSRRARAVLDRMGFVELA